jgi:hypothetical protein
VVDRYVTPRSTVDHLFDMKSDERQIPELEVTPLFLLGHVNGIAHQSARL